MIGRTRRRSGAGVAGLAVAAAALSALLPAARARAVTTGPVLMVVGDSISQGQEGDFTWRYRLWQHLTADGADVTFTGPRTEAHDIYTEASDAEYRVPAGQWNSAHDALWGRALWQEKDTVAQEITAASPRPDTLLVELGSNDLFFDRTPDMAIADMTSFVANVRAVAPAMRILLGSVPGRTPLADHPGIPASVAAYDTALAQFVAAHTTAQSPLVDVDLTAGWDPTVDTHDGVHPNETGEWLLARDFGNALAAGFGIGEAFPATPPSSFPTLAQTTPTLSIVSGSGTAAPVLGWTHSFGADGYRIYESDLTAGTPYAPLPYPIAGDSWTTGFLQADHTYAYVVKALRGEGTPTDSSSAVSNEIVTDPPATPTATTSPTPTPTSSPTPSAMPSPSSEPGPLPSPPAPVAFATPTPAGGKACTPSSSPEDARVTGVLHLAVSGVPGLSRSLTIKHALSFGDRQCDGLARTMTLILRSRKLAVTLRLALHGERWTGTLSIAALHGNAATWSVDGGTSERQLSLKHSASGRSGHVEHRLTWTLTLPVGTPTLAN